MELTIEMKAIPGKAQELYQTLQALLPTIRKEKGFLNCRVSRDEGDEELFSLVIDWEKRARLEHYMHTTNGSALLGAVDLLSEAARVRFGRKSPWEGIDTLKRMRDGP
jgi:quinol monooxygenase YgiN